MAIYPAPRAGLHMRSIGPEGQHKEILVVDDHPEITAMIADVLAEEGYRIRVAHNGVDALRAVQMRRPDLILMDIAMPVMRGDQALCRLRAQGVTDLPVILMTADERPERFSELGARQIIRKPFDVGSLLELVGAYL